MYSCVAWNIAWNIAWNKHGFKQAWFSLGQSPFVTAAVSTAPRLLQFGYISCGAFLSKRHHFPPSVIGIVLIIRAVCILYGLLSLLAHDRAVGWFPDVQLQFVKMYKVLSHLTQSVCPTRLQNVLHSCTAFAPGRLSGCSFSFCFRFHSFHILIIMIYYGWLRSSVFFAGFFHTSSLPLVVFSPFFYFGSKLTHPL